MICPRCGKSISRKQMATMLGKKGGKSSSKAKVAAARKNAKLGGRPFGSKNKPK